MLKLVLIFNVILIIECIFTNELKSHKKVASILLKPEKTEAFDNFIRKLPHRNLRSLNGTKIKKLSKRVANKQDILTPDTISDVWNYGLRDNNKNNNDRNWILCQIVKNDLELCENCELCDNIIRVQTGVQIATEDEILTRNIDNLNTNPRFRPKIIRKKTHKKIVSPSFDNKRDNKSLLEKVQKDRENETMTILKSAYRESRISLKEYLTMLNNLVFLSNKPLLRVNGPLATSNLDENDIDVQPLGRTVPKMATEDNEETSSVPTTNNPNIHNDDTTIQI